MGWIRFQAQVKPEIRLGPNCVSPASVTHVGGGRKLVFFLFYLGSRAANEIRGVMASYLLHSHNKNEEGEGVLVWKACWAINVKARAVTLLWMRWCCRRLVLAVPRTVETIECQVLLLTQTPSISLLPLLYCLFFLCSVFLFPFVFLLLFYCFLLLLPFLSSFFFSFFLLGSGSKGDRPMGDRVLGVSWVFVVGLELGFWTRGLAGWWSDVVGLVWDLGRWVR